MTTGNVIHGVGGNGFALPDERVIVAPSPSLTLAAGVDAIGDVVVAFVTTSPSASEDDDDDDDDTTALAANRSALSRVGGATPRASCFDASMRPTTAACDDAARGDTGRALTTDVDGAAAVVTTPSSGANATLGLIDVDGDDGDDERNELSTRLR